MNLLSGMCFHLFLYHSCFFFPVYPKFHWVFDFFLCSCDLWEILYILNPNYIFCGLRSYIFNIILISRCCCFMIVNLICLSIYDWLLPCSRSENLQTLTISSESSNFNFAYFLFGIGPYIAQCGLRLTM